MVEEERDEFLDFKKNWTLEELNKDIDSLAEHPLFAKDITKISDNEGIKAIQNLLYDEDDETAAENFYQQGNKILNTNIIGKTPHKEDKNYFLHQALFKYNEAVECKIIEPSLKAKVLCNRALVQTKIKNFGNAIADSDEAILIDKNYIKAYYRKAFAQYSLDNLEDAMKTCNEALETSSNKEIEDLRKTIKASQDKLKQKQMEAEKRDQLLKTDLLQHCIKNGILYSDQPTLKLPDTYTPRFYVEDGALVTSVIFIYPEFGQFDFVDEAYDNNLLEDVFSTVYGEGLPWDGNKYYTSFSDIEFYVELNAKRPLNDAGYQSKPLQLMQLSLPTDLRSVLKTPEFIVPKTLEIIVLSKASNFQKHFLKRYVQ